MNAYCLVLLSLLIIAMVSTSWEKENLLPSIDICRLFKDGTKLRKPGTCNESIKCQNFISTTGDKCSQWFSIETSKCTSKKPPDDYCKTPCKKTSPMFVNDPKNCNGWYQCNGAKEVSIGTCPSNQIFDQKQQRCTYDSSCIATYNFCDIVPMNIAFQNENNCRKYYKCNKKGEAESFECGTGQYFNKATAACDVEPTGKCYKYSPPENVCGNSKEVFRNRFVNDGATCRGYYYCKDQGVGVKDTSPSWGQCSTSEFFNASEQSCQDRYHVKCNKDRCDGRLNKEKELSGRRGCQHFLICGEDGKTIEEVYCGKGLYFDVKLSLCTSNLTSYGACT